MLSSKQSRAWRGREGRLLSLFQEFAKPRPAERPEPPLSVPAFRRGPERTSGVQNSWQRVRVLIGPHSVRLCEIESSSQSTFGVRSVRVCELRASSQTRTVRGATPVRELAESERPAREQPTPSTTETGTSPLDSGTCDRTFAVGTHAARVRRSTGLAGRGCPSRKPNAAPPQPRRCAFYHGRRRRSPCKDRPLPRDEPPRDSTLSLRDSRVAVMKAAEHGLRHGFPCSFATSSSRSA